MAANGNYNVNLNLIDGEATKKLRELNQQLAKAQAPLKAYQRELKRFNDLSGRTQKIAAYNKALGNMKTRLSSVGQTLNSIIRPMAAVFGIGSIASVIGLTRSFAEWGNEIRNTSALLGITAQKAVALKQAGNLAGIGDQVQAERSFQDTQNSISMGQNATGAYANQILGINPRMDFQKAEIQAATRINQLFKEGRINAAQARNILSQSGMNADLFGQDPKRLQKAFDLAKQNAAEMAPYTEQAVKWRDTLAEAGGRIDVIKTKLEAALEPALGPIVQKFIDWTHNGKAVDATMKQIADAAKSVGDFVSHIDFSKLQAGVMFFINHWKAFLAGFVFLKGLSIAASATAFVSDLMRIAAGFKAVTTAAEAAKVAETAATTGSVATTVGVGALATGGVLAAGAAAAYSGHELYKTYKKIHSDDFTVNSRRDRMKYNEHLTNLQQNERQYDAMNYIVSKGYSKEAAAGIVGSIRQESGFSLNNVGDNGNAIGVGMWHPDREKAIVDHFGKKIENMTFHDQLDAWLWDSKQKDQRKANRELTTATTAAQGTIGALDFERPAEWNKNGINGTEFRNRLAYTNSALNQYNENHKSTNSNTNDGGTIHIVSTIHDNRTETKVVKNTTNMNPNVKDIKVVSKSGIQRG